MYKQNIPTPPALPTAWPPGASRAAAAGAAPARCARPARPSPEAAAPPPVWWALCWFVFVVWVRVEGVYNTIQTPIIFFLIIILVVVWCGWGGGRVCEAQATTRRAINPMNGAIRQHTPRRPCLIPSWPPYIHTHTHTHTYLYIYINSTHRSPCIIPFWPPCSAWPPPQRSPSSQSPTAVGFCLCG